MPQVSEPAEADLLQIVNYIAGELMDPTAARHLVATIAEAIIMIGDLLDNEQPMGLAGVKLHTLLAAYSAAINMGLDKEVIQILENEIDRRNVYPKME